MAVDEFCSHTEPGKRCVGSIKHAEGKHEMTAWNSAIAQAVERQTMPDRVKAVRKAIDESEATLAAGQVHTVEEVIGTRESAVKGD